MNLKYFMIVTFKTSRLCTVYMYISINLLIKFAFSTCCNNKVMDKAIFNPRIPYVGYIGGDGKLSPQKLIKIQGMISKISYGFDISLQCGSNTIPNDDIALQISVRFLKGYICVNSLRHGIWGKEIRKSTVPFEIAENFDIAVLFGVDLYEVTINGEHYFDFPQIIRYDKISHLSINGDVSIIQICYESASSTDTSIVENNDRNAEIFDSVELGSTSRNALLPPNNSNNDAKFQGITTTCENKREVYCVLCAICIFVIFGIVSLMVLNDDNSGTNNGTNVGGNNINYGYFGRFRWYNYNEGFEEMPRIPI